PHLPAAGESSAAPDVPAAREDPETDRLPATEPAWEDDEDYHRFLMSLSQKQANGARDAGPRAAAGNGGNGSSGSNGRGRAGQARNGRRSGAGNGSPADPSVIKGRPIKGDPMPIGSVEE